MTELRCASNSRISEPSFVMKDGTSPRFFMSIILNSAVDLAAIERRDCREKNLCCPIVKIDVHMPGEAGASRFCTVAERQFEGSRGFQAAVAAQTRHSPRSDD